MCSWCDGKCRVLKKGSPNGFSFVMDSSGNYLMGTDDCNSCDFHKNKRVLTKFVNPPKDTISRKYPFCSYGPNGPMAPQQQPQRPLPKQPTNPFIQYSGQFLSKNEHSSVQVFSDYMPTKEELDLAHKRSPIHQITDPPQQPTDTPMVYMLTPTSMLWTCPGYPPVRGFCSFRTKDEKHLNSEISVPPMSLEELRGRLRASLSQMSTDTPRKLSPFEEFLERWNAEERFRKQERFEYFKQNYY